MLKGDLFIFSTRPLYFIILKKEIKICNAYDFVFLQVTE